MLALSQPLATNQAAASTHHEPSGRAHDRTASEPRGRQGGAKRVANAKYGLKGRYYAWHGGLQCVSYARSASGIELAGNAANWWDNAAGLYARGSSPEAGSVLNFRANGRMHMGHVAVVADVVNSRVIEVDHANWAGPGTVRGGVSRGIRVVDVSADNDWTAVRVALGHTGDFGSIYPTYGFIYPRPDRGEPVLASSAARSDAPADAAGADPLPTLNPPPADLRGGFGRARLRYVAWHTGHGHHGRSIGRAHPLRLSLSD